MDNKIESFNIGKIRKEPVQLELFPNEIKGEVLEILSAEPKNIYDKNKIKKYLIEIDPIDWDIL